MTHNLLLILWVLVVHFFAYRRGYFHLDSTGSSPSRVRLWHLIVASCVVFLGLPLAVMLANLFRFPFLYRVMYCGIFIGMLVLTHAWGLMDEWFFPKGRRWKALWRECGAGVVCWLAAAPVVSLVATGVEALLRWIMQHDVVYEQVPVMYLKALRFHHVISFIIMLLFVCVFDPLMEELFFRGFLQSFLKKFVSLKWSIFLTSGAFAMAHYSPLQYMGNYVFIITIFVFSLYLGFIKEKRGSLVSAWALHAVFNTVNSISILMSSL